MSKRCELQKEYYKEFGNYKGVGKYSDHYVKWLENEVLALRLYSENFIKMKLFLLTTDGLGDYYIIAETPNDAEKLLTTQLNEADYGFTSNRIIRNIKILTNEIKIGFNDKLNFNDDNRMIIFRGALANEHICFDWTL